MWNKSLLLKPFSERLGSFWLALENPSKPKRTEKKSHLSHLGLPVPEFSLWTNKPWGYKPRQHPFLLFWCPGGGLDPSKTRSLKRLPGKPEDPCLDHVAVNPWGSIHLVKCDFWIFSLLLFGIFLMRESLPNSPCENCHRRSRYESLPHSHQAEEFIRAMVALHPEVDIPSLFHWTMVLLMFLRTDWMWEDTHFHCGNTRPSPEQRYPACSSSGCLCIAWVLRGPCVKPRERFAPLATKFTWINHGVVPHRFQIGGRCLSWISS